MHSDILCVILGGGRGSRLWPLTKARAKPAVPIGGKYRLIDISISNCLHSGINRIAVLTQFNSISLRRHIVRAYHFDHFNTGWVQILAAEQTSAFSDWYQGTADAVRKQLPEILAAAPEHVLILAGDHLYRMDYSDMIAQHKARDAEITVAVKPASRREARRFGVLKETDNGRIVDFLEKPKSEDLSGKFVAGDNTDLPYRASMGIYLFRTRTLVDLLDSLHMDFGGQLIPAALPAHRTYSHTFDGYWEDIGTIESFYHANLALTRSDPAFSFHDATRPIYTRSRFLPGCRIFDVELDQVLLADGCIVEKANIRNSLIGNRSVIGHDTEIRNTVLMGADHYEEEVEHPPPGAPVLGIGEGARIHGAIIDKNARIGPRVRIEPFPREVDIDEEHWAVRDGIVVIHKNAIIPAGTVIAPPSAEKTRATHRRY